MPMVARLPAGTRFFARPERFVCECPYCGLIISAHQSPSQPTTLTPRQKRRTRGFIPGQPYNPVVGRLRCPSCARIWGVGLILWPVANSGGRGVQLRPPDFKPTALQAAALKQYSVGLLARMPGRKLGPNDPHNLAVTSECTCPELEGGWAPACPVHGWEAEQEADQLARMDPDDVDEPDDPEGESQG